MNAANTHRKGATMRLAAVKRGGLAAGGTRAQSGDGTRFMLVQGALHLWCFRWKSLLYSFCLLHF